MTWLLATWIVGAGAFGMLVLAAVILGAADTFQADLKPAVSPTGGPFIMLKSRLTHTAVRRSSTRRAKPLAPSGNYFWRDGGGVGFRMAIEALTIGMIAGLVVCGVHCWAVLLRSL